MLLQTKISKHGRKHIKQDEKPMASSLFDAEFNLTSSFQERMPTGAGQSTSPTSSQDSQEVIFNFIDLTRAKT